MKRGKKNHEAKAVKEKEAKEMASSDNPVSASKQTPEQGNLGKSMDGRQRGERP